MNATKTRCEAVDQIVRWDEVQEGDLALTGRGVRDIVTTVVQDTSQPAYVGIRFEGVTWLTWFRRDWETAVTRYVETPEGSKR